MCIWLFFENKTPSNKNQSNIDYKDCIRLHYRFCGIEIKQQSKPTIAKVSSTSGRSFSWAFAAIKKWTLVSWWIQLSLLKYVVLLFLNRIVLFHQTPNSKLRAANSEQSNPSSKIRATKAEKQNPSYVIRAATSELMWIQDTGFLYPHHTCIYIAVFINIYTIWYLFNTTITYMGLIYDRYFERWTKSCSIS